MKNIFKSALLFLSFLTAGFGLSSCNSDPYVIRVSASEIPHAKILNDVIKPILKEQGYTLKVAALDWAIQNDALAHDEYDANYFQHTPFLNSYGGKIELVAAAKIHYEKLCMYSSDKDTNGKLDNGETIEIVNDISNVERALKLLENNNILTINKSNYDDKGNFVNFNVNKPNECVTFLPGYEKCKLTCLTESNLCFTLPDYHFGIIPGNTALTGLGPTFKDRIVLSESLDNETVSNLTNVIAVKKDNLSSPKTKVLVESFADPRVKEYIENTYGDVVKYNYIPMI